MLLASSQLGQRGISRAQFLQSSAERNVGFVSGNRKLTHALKVSTLVCPRLSGAVRNQLFSNNRHVDKCPNYAGLSNNWQMSLVLDFGAVMT